MFLKMKYIIIIILKLFVLKLLSSQDNVIIIKKLNLYSYAYCFMNDNKIFIQDENKTRIYDIKNDKFIYEKNTNKLYYEKVNSLNDLIIYSSIGIYLKSDCYIFNYKENKTIDLSSNFDKAYEKYFYFDYYGNAQSIIYQYTTESYENVKDFNFLYKILKFNIATNSKELLFNNARLVDYNNGLLLYQDMTIKDKEVYKLYDQNKKQIIDTFINDRGLKYLKIFKNNSYIGILYDKNGGKLFILKGKEISKIKINDLSNCYSNYQYNFNNDLIIINYESNFFNKKIFLIFKIK